MTEAEIVALIGLAGAILVALINNYFQNKNLDKRLNKIEEHDAKQYLGILRLTIMSENMPISERIIAGKEYIDRGGNGDVKKFYNEFLEQHTI